MTFYDILWVSIFALGGISLGILGMADLDIFTLFLINPRIFNRLILDTESFYVNASFPYATAGTLEIQKV